MKVFCIIPALNEAKTIVSVITEVKPLVDSVVVVDDCSQDDTKKLAQSAGAIVLRHALNRGQGAALQTGNDYALAHDADIIVHFDADGQFQSSEIKDIIEPILNDQADIVFGSRFLGKKSNLPKAKEKIILPLARLINKIFFGINLTDPQNGFRALNRQSAEIIKIKHDGMAHCSEILHQAKQNNRRMKEIPVTVRYDEFGQKFSGGLRILKDLILKKIIG